MDYQLFVTQGLGDNSYVVTSGDEAVLVDPQRDAWRFLEGVASKKHKLRFVLETHVRNDYVSGALETRAATGAEIAASAKGSYAFEHRAVADGDEFQVGALRIRAMETPGHTPEHLAWVVYEGSAQEPVAVFTGGSLIVGGAGRTDLLGPDRAEELTRAQFQTVRRLAGLPGTTRLLPTHGAGSFCTATISKLTRTSTIETERQDNPALAAPDVDTFIRRQLTGLSAYPAYYQHMGPINRAGPSVLGSLPKAGALAPERFAERIASRAWVVDARDPLAFAQAHLPGSVNIGLGSAFGTYVGWVVPFSAPLLLVLPEPWERSLPEAVTQLIRIGYDTIEGHLAGGVEAWRGEGRPVRSYPSATIDDLCCSYVAGEPLQVLDVRQRGEWEAGHIPESFHVFLGDLPNRLQAVAKDKEVWTICASGYRASIAASLLDRAGVPVRVVAQGGVPEWLAHCYPSSAATT